MASSSSQRQRRILIGLLGIVGAVVWMQFLFLPQFRTAGRLGRELKTLRSQVDRTKRDLRQISELEKNRALLVSQYPMPVLSIPPEEQLPDLMERIAQAARVSHVRVITLRPKQELAQLRAGVSGYLEIPLELSATAGYHQIGHFLDLLEQSDTLVGLKEMEIQPGSQDLWNHQVRMVLLAFLVPAQGRTSNASLRGTK